MNPIAVDIRIPAVLPPPRAVRPRAALGIFAGLAVGLAAVPVAMFTVFGPHAPDQDQLGATSPGWTLRLDDAGVRPR